MSTRSRIVWWLETDAAEDEEDEHIYLTKGWLDESDPLRWTLATALMIEGTHNGRWSASTAAEAAEIEWGEDESGKRVTIAKIPLEE